jgi:hypothetical protein
MKVIMKRNGHGFGMDWTLSYRGKEYFLGQDGKVCSRLIGMSPLSVIEEISESTGLSFAKSRDIQDNKRANTRLAQIIVESIGITSFKGVEPWDLCVD